MKEWPIIFQLALCISWYSILLVGFLFFFDVPRQVYERARRWFGKGIRTDIEINCEITALRAIINRVCAIEGLIGPSHRELLDAEIAVLDKRMTQSHINAKYGHESTRWIPVWQTAMYALQWMEGKVDKPPSQRWVPMAE